MRRTAHLAGTTAAAIIVGLTLSQMATAWAEEVSVRQ